MSEQVPTQPVPEDAATAQASAPHDGTPASPMTTAPVAPIAPQHFAAAPSGPAYAYPSTNPTVAFGPVDQPVLESNKKHKAWVRPTVLAVTGAFLGLGLFSSGVFVGHGIGGSPDFASASKLEVSEDSTGQDPRSRALPALPDDSTAPNGGDSRTQDSSSSLMVVGEITTLDGTTFTLTSQQGAIKVITSSETSSSAELSVGEVVMVIGTADQDGNLAASRVLSANGTASGGSSDSNGDGAANGDAGTGTDQTSLT